MRFIDIMYTILKMTKDFPYLKGSRGMTTSLPLQNLYTGSDVLPNAIREVEVDERVSCSISQSLNDALLGRFFSLSSIVSVFSLRFRLPSRGFSLGSSFPATLEVGSRHDFLVHW